jgi:thiamine pyrophosphokinase
MKALLVGASPTEGSSALVALLAAQSDLVVAVDGGGTVCLAAGVTPDVLLGDLDSIDPADADRLERAGVLLQRFPTEKDATDLELALDYVAGAGAREVTATAISGGRLDHILGNLGALRARVGLQPRIVEPDLAAWMLGEGGRSALRLMGVEATVSLVPLGEGAVVSVDGVRWPLNRARLEPCGTLGISNRIVSPRGAFVAVESGEVLVVSPRVGALALAFEG